MPTSAFINDKYVSKYVGLGCRTPSQDEIAVRCTARNLKIPTSDAIEQAAPEMAALIDGPCWLVPVPASDGTTAANTPNARKPPDNVELTIELFDTVDLSVRSGDVELRIHPTGEHSSC